MDTKLKLTDRFGYVFEYVSVVLYIGFFGEL